MIYGKLVFTLELHIWCAHFIISDDLRPKHVAVVMNIIVFQYGSPNKMHIQGATQKFWDELFWTSTVRYI
jgi:hypothetical protein